MFIMSHLTGFNSRSSPQGAVTTWNPSDKSSNITLSNGNRTAARASGVSWASARATSGVIDGAWYWEILLSDHTSANGDLFLGTGDSAFGLDAGPLALVEYCGCRDSSTTTVASSGITTDFSAFGSPTWLTGDLIQFALNMDSRRLWVGRNNTWYNSGDPAAGTGYVFSNLPSKSFYPAIALYDNLVTVTGQFSGATQTYAPPSGFTPIGA